MCTRAAGSGLGEFGEAATLAGPDRWLGLTVLGAPHLAQRRQQPRVPASCRPGPFSGRHTSLSDVSSPQFPIMAPPPPTRRQPSATPPEPQPDPPFPRQDLNFRGRQPRVPDVHGRRGGSPRRIRPNRNPTHRSQGETSTFADWPDSAISHGGDVAGSGPHVQRARSEDATLRVRCHLSPLRQPARHPPEGEQNSEHIGGEAHRPID